MKRVVLILSLLVVLLALPATAAAQESTPTPPEATATATPTPPPPIPTRTTEEEQSIVEAGIERWMMGSGEQTLLRIVGFAVGSIVHGVRTWIAPLFGESATQSLLVQLPLHLTAQEPWVVAKASQTQGMATTALVGAFSAALLVAGFRGALWGATWQEVTGAIPAVLVVGIALQKHREVLGQCIAAANTFALSLFADAATLPGWEHLSAPQQLSGQGFEAIALLLVALPLSFARFLTLMAVNLLIVIAPLALLTVLIPGMGFLFRRWLLALGIGITLHIPQAMAIGLGNSLVSAFGAGAEALSLVMALSSYWLAFRLPGMLSTLHQMGGAVGGLRSVGRFALAGLTGGPVAAGAASIHEVGRAAGNVTAVGAMGWAAGDVIRMPTRTTPLLPASLRALPAP